MRILVVSDSHGRLDALRYAVRAEGNFAMMIHLGDGASDVQTVQSMLDGRPLLQVRGNCDLASTLPEIAVTQEGGYTLFCTHGHRQMVKYGTETLIETARQAGADIALYGHTHEPVQQYLDGLYVCNPGALMNGRYAVVELVPQGIVWLPKKIG